MLFVIVHLIAVDEVLSLILESCVLTLVAADQHGILVGDFKVDQHFGFASKRSFAFGAVDMGAWIFDF